MEMNIGKTGNCGEGVHPYYGGEPGTKTSKTINAAIDLIQPHSYSSKLTV